MVEAEVKNMRFFFMSFHSKSLKKTKSIPAEFLSEKVRSTQVENWSKSFAALKDSPILWRFPLETSQLSSPESLFLMKPVGFWRHGFLYGWCRFLLLNLARGDLKWIPHPLDLRWNQVVPNASKARFWKKFAEELKGEEQSRKYAHGYQAKALNVERLEVWMIGRADRGYVTWFTYIHLICFIFIIDNIYIYMSVM